jgi:hypothetical protein
MRHFLQREALPVLALTERVDEPPVEARLILPPGAAQALPPGRYRAGRRAVPVPAVARPAQVENRPASRTGTTPQLFQDAPTTRTDVDNADGPCKMEVMGWLDPAFGRPAGQPGGSAPGCRLWGVVDHTTMTLGNPGQETERSTSRAFRRSLTAHRNGQQDEYEAQLTNTFGLLREGWERAVEELLLNQTVMRFDHRVQTQRIKNLHDIRQGDIDEIDAGMSVCSKWLPGHAQAPAINEPLPEPAALLAEIERLERFAQEMRKRGRS